MKTDSLPFAFFENKITPIEKANVSIMTNALQYGTGIFGGIRGYFDAEKKQIAIFRLPDHFERFISSINILGCEFKYTSKDLEKIAIDLMKKNKPITDVYFRPFAYVGHYGLTPSLANVTLDYAMYMIPLGDYLPTDKGLSVMVSSWQRISDRSIPSRAKITGGYINSALARKEANDLGFDEAIMLNDSGHVAEGSAENIFIVRNGTLITPAQTDDILEGITRRSIIQIAKDLGIPVEIRSIDRSELYVCQEAFFSGTGVQVAWISKVDGRTVGNGKRGPVGTQIQDMFFSILRGKEAKYCDWNTIIKTKEYEK